MSSFTGVFGNAFLEKAHKGARFGRKSQSQQRVHAKRSIATPAIPIVPFEGKCVEKGDNWIE